MTVVTSDAFVQIVIKAEFLYILISPPISFGFTRHYSHHVISLGLAWPLRGFCPDLDGATVLYAALEALTLQKQALKTARTMSSKEPKQHSRIPVALQMIFLHSNRGFNVDQPPPERVASRVFPRRFFTKKQSSNASKPPLPKEVYVSKVRNRATVFGRLLAI
jgi:hypothetical protein